MTAIAAWGTRDETRPHRLASVPQPTLAADGDNDLVVPTENTHRLGELIPDPKVSIYRDAGHGFLFRYPSEFGAEANAFLGE